MPSNEELRALVERLRGEAKVEIATYANRGYPTYNAGRADGLNDAADELSALLPPEQPPEAYTAVPNWTEQQIKDWQEEE